MNPLRALLISRNHDLDTALAKLLKRAGFDVDLLWLFGKQIINSSFSKTYITDSTISLIEMLVILSKNNKYDLVVICEDQTLLDVINSNLPNDIKLNILPILSLDKSSHLFSKIGLSKFLVQHGINTPPYQVAFNEVDLLTCAKTVGYPLILKIDSSSAGKGVFECHTPNDILANLAKYSYPLLIQKWIEGESLDLSAFYQNGKLVYFTYATMLKSIDHKFGPTVLRSYRQLATVENEVFEELESLGTALGADGFSNISAIQSKEDNRRYYFEADMRPNAWVDHGKYLGNDAAVYLKDYFKSGILLNYPQEKNPFFPEITLLPNLKRLTFWEMILNKYNCWRYFDNSSHFTSCFLTIITNNSRNFIKPRLPSVLWLKAQYFYSRIKHLSFDLKF